MELFNISEKIRKIMGGYGNPDERELVRRFQELTAENRHFYYFSVTQNKEAKIGADFLWLILTNAGVNAFLVQAKKLKDGRQTILKKDVNYKSGSGKRKERQIDILLRQSEASGIPAIYMLFSLSIQSFHCDLRKHRTDEGVFIDTAQNLDHFSSTTHGAPNHLPISCLFACLSKKCNYDAPKMLPHQVCIVCRGCTDCVPDQAGRSRRCPAPIDRFMADRYRLAASTRPLSWKLLTFTVAFSKLKYKAELLLDCLREQVDAPTILPDKIIITDYMNRHSDDYLCSLLGSDFPLDRNTVLEQTQIVATLKKLLVQYPLFEKIGLFGSYSRESATPDSDIDLALVYRKNSVTNAESQAQLCEFLKETVNAFHKNVDFVDYCAAARTESGEDFIPRIDKDMIWIYPPSSKVGRTSRKNR